MSNIHEVQVAIIGAGPAGLMAAEVLSQQGFAVDVFDAMPSVGRKFLLAGIGGLNITHSEDYTRFCTRYTDRQTHLQAMLDAFTPEALRAWVHGLGVDTFVGSSGRVFPKEMKAAPLLRAWLHRLRAQGVRIHARHRWLGWNEAWQLRLHTPDGEITVSAHATVLALGGASWPKLGSDGAWVPWLQAQAVEVAPLRSANCGFEVAWSPYLRDKHAGSPLKSVALRLVTVQGDVVEKPGELLISREGVEGSLIYACSKDIRELIAAQGKATLHLDLLPGKSLERVQDELKKLRRAYSIASELKSKLGIAGAKLALLHETLGKEQMQDMPLLARTLKALPLTLTAARPIEEAISTAGGVCFEGLDENLMIKQIPGTFVAGEMLDWEAPTGGYLLTACFASGQAAGLGVARWLHT